MISGVSSVSSSLYTGSNSSSISLTDEDKKKLNSILANFDSSNMTQDSTKSLLDQLKSSGVQPSQAVQTYISSKGFDIKPPQGTPPQGPPPQGPPPSGSTSDLSSLASTSLSSVSSSSSTNLTSITSSNENLPSFLQDFIDKENAGTVTQDDINSLIASLKNSGQSTTGTLVDQSS